MKWRRVGSFLVIGVSPFVARAASPAHREASTALRVLTGEAALPRNSAPCIRCTQINLMLLDASPACPYGGISCIDQSASHVCLMRRPAQFGRGRCVGGGDACAAAKRHLRAAELKGP